MEGHSSEFLTVSEAAAELGISPSGLRTRIERGQVHAIRRHPRLLLISRAEVERWKAMGKPRRGPKPRQEHEARG